jgi:hypothetical protein
MQLEKKVKYRAEQVQVRSREELVKRLSNVQNLVSTSANPTFQRDIKISNIQSLIG